MWIAPYILTISYENMKVNGSPPELFRFTHTARKQDLTADHPDSRTAAPPSHSPRYVSNPLRTSGTSVDYRSAVVSSSEAAFLTSVQSFGRRRTINTGKIIIYKNRLFGSFGARSFLFPNHLNMPLSPFMYSKREYMV